MAYSWVLVPFIAAFIGWLINRIAIQMLFRRVLPKRKEQLARQIGSIAATELLSFNDIAENISNPENVSKVMPQLEVHIDSFLRVKLPEQMPVIGMFIGDKTIAQLKAVFTAELEALFPVVMHNYAQQLQGEMDLEKMITGKLLSIPPGKLENKMITALEREFRVFGWMGAVSGFVTGCIAVLLTWFV